jgi:choline monooxygenase
MHPELKQSIGAYNVSAPLERAETIPSAWYTDPRFLELEYRNVFGRTWQVVGRVDQLTKTGDYITATVGKEPIVVTVGADSKLRGFFNVCRHHAAAVMTEPAGTTPSLRCPYHGWTYGLDGELKGTPEFEGVCGFDKADNGLVPVRVATWEQFVFVCLDDKTPDLETYLGDLAPHAAKLDLSKLRFVERKSYEVGCNWKVFVDNYLDGGYHVPHIHKSLGSVLSYQNYEIENGERYCVQSSPIISGGDADTAAVRGGEAAYYYWLHPNFMINWYEGYMDTNLALPLSADRTLVIFDFYFPESEASAATEQEKSVAVADRVQQEDIDVCESVQRGLASRAYDTGRLSVRRETGEHLFHRLLSRDLSGDASLNGK